MKPTLLLLLPCLPGSSGGMAYFMAANGNSSCLCANSSLPPFLSLIHQGHSCPKALAYTVSSSPDGQFSGQPPSSDATNSQSPSTSSPSRTMTPRVCVISCSDSVLTADLLVHPLSRNVTQVQQSHLAGSPCPIIWHQGKEIQLWVE